MEKETYQTKWNSLEEAKEAAVIASKFHKKEIYVIESFGKFYADENSFIRNWERLCLTYNNGELIE